MAEATTCTTTAHHCVNCGRPTERMVGSLSDCCERRVTTMTTCDGNHPDHVPGPGMTDEQIDEALVPAVLSLVQSLTAAGRTPVQAFADVRRAIDLVELNAE